MSSICNSFYNDIIAKVQQHHNFSTNQDITLSLDKATFGTLPPNAISTKGWFANKSLLITGLSNIGYRIWYVLNYNGKNVEITFTQNLIVTNPPTCGNPPPFQNYYRLSVPQQLNNLREDKYGMLELSANNSQIIEQCLKQDKSYKPYAQALVKYLLKGKGVSSQGAAQFSLDEWTAIVEQINADNSTRASAITCQAIAKYIQSNCSTFLSQLQCGDWCVVDDLQHAVASQLVPSGQKAREEKSLCSKVCKYLAEWICCNHDFFVYDEVVKSVLDYYLKFYNITGNSYNSYQDYCQLLKSLLNEVNKTQNLTAGELDHILWYGYKNDAVRTAIAKELANYNL